LFHSSDIGGEAKGTFGGGCIKRYLIFWKNISIKLKFFSKKRGDEHWGALVLVVVDIR